MYSSFSIFNQSGIFIGRYANPLTVTLVAAEDFFLEILELAFWNSEEIDRTAVSKKSDSSSSKIIESLETKES
ncbi:Hypothetical predicted protein [Olea europaea subsp. europaea]|uniref:Uncharacterized protein n=1 Tax=Olea europaea subsp. europaea TaxID=158383 RepID=A0A8S0V0T1_OLEEU|nr:Hypothetical predicted protein [Olea europaea subsp. europaea]